MNKTEQSSAHPQFRTEVFTAEIQEISHRRRNCEEHFPEPSLENALTVKNHLTGLACSGGGIRSASFSLGVIQHLISKKLFHKVDYLSTVSGGGYIGSCISALTKEDSQGANLLTDRTDDAEAPALNHIRNYSAYLRSSGFMNQFRIPVLFVEGVLRSILTFFPIIVLAVFLTELYFELTDKYILGSQWHIPLIGVIPVVGAFLLRPIVKDKQAWFSRDRADARLISYVTVAVMAIMVVPVLAILREIVSNGAPSLFSLFEDWVQANLVSVAVTSTILLLTIMISLKTLRTQSIAMFTSCIAPGTLLIIYVFFCLNAIRSPYIYDVESNIKENMKTQCRKLTDTKLAPDTKTLLETNLSQLLEPTLLRKNIDVSSYQVRCIGSHYIHLQNSKPEPSWWIRHLTTQDKERLDIQLESHSNAERFMLKIDQFSLLKGNAEWWFYALGVVIYIYNWFFININRFSLHPFYRDRLSRTFLISEQDGELSSADTLKMSELNGEKSNAPYHLINTALNLQGSRDPQLRSRKTVPFILSKRHCGSDYTGYCKTKELEAADTYFNLGTAMAISAAAASPNMGTGTIKPLTFLLTLLNVRLNYWLPHPQKLRDTHWKSSFRLRPLGLSYLIKEALGNVSERTSFINCSDGGHIENLAVYELLRRQCKTIICIDAEADPTFSFHGLITLQRYAEIDLGIKIALDVRTIKPENDISSRNFSEGTIHYNNGETGRLLYLKLSFTGNEPEYLHYYKSCKKNYPHESTSDQFFDETQFEAYRALGNFVASCAEQEINTLLTS